MYTSLRSVYRALCTVPLLFTMTGCASFMMHTFRAPFLGGDIQPLGAYPAARTEFMFLVHPSLEGIAQEGEEPWYTLEKFKVPFMYVFCLVDLGPSTLLDTVFLDGDIRENKRRSLTSKPKENSPSQ